MEEDKKENIEKDTEKEFGKIEDTLFVPMLGRIYATENFPNILNDKTAINIKERLPKDIKGKDTQTQYTLLAGAARSSNMDRYIKRFIEENENGVIVQLGCGLETTFHRNNNGKTKFYEVDLPNVIEYRKGIFEENALEKLISCSALSEDWIKEIRKENPESPIMIIAGGLLYYFKEEEMYEVFKFLKKYGNIEIVFDIFNKQGMKSVKRYMKQVGHEDAKMYFYVENIDKLKKDTGYEDISEEAYYKYIDKKGLKLITKLTMKISDMFMIVKMIHMKNH